MLVLADAEFEMMDRFVTAMGRASLLCDLVDAETVGLHNALRVVVKHPETEHVGIRVDSGDIAAQDAPQRSVELAMVTRRPAVMAASVRQERTRRSSISTVQAPHWP